MRGGRNDSLEAPSAMREKVGSPILIKSLLSSVKMKILLTALFTLICLINDHVLLLNGRETFEGEAYVLVSVFVMAKLAESLTSRQSSFILQNTIRAALVAMLYRKGFSLSTLWRQSYTSGEIINIMNVDTERVAEFVGPFRTLKMNLNSFYRSFLIQNLVQRIRLSH